MAKQQNLTQHEAEVDMPKYCAWCWRNEYPKKKFPKRWTSGICAIHSQQVFADLEATTQQCIGVVYEKTPYRFNATQFFPHST
jgi:hypothetical protein